ncbi:esterase [Vibrio navarrensis]|uniref:patatin-like phospholipase family protein n=1 Tax=Vibrio navarrensis TaxID=29495 RepID=UPI00052C8934|nr:patatin-like phospholipase family protein [Vibrio navarrensis]KGK17884.1 esterase [Vibrio navarrensis]
MAINSGIVTNGYINLDTERFAKYQHGKTALVAQGGGQRGIFTAGVLDAFILANFDPFDEFFGTSAGALNLCSYLCRQHGLGKAFITELTTSQEFFNLFSYIRNKQYLGLDWALDKICAYPYKLDLDLGETSLACRQAFASVTDTSTLTDKYLPIFGPNWYQTMLATCAIPKLYSNPVTIGGREYVDGGVSASIPVQEAWRRNARAIIVIRTEPFALPEKADVKQSAATQREEIEWFRRSFGSVQGKWQSRLNRWKDDWSHFFQQQIAASQSEKGEPIRLLNGGRWLFGADNIYRLSHLIGDNFDSGLADMLMVHYQTYTLTRDFLAKPPDDTFVIQITPDGPLRSSSLLSNKKDLLADYELGVQAGNRFIAQYESLRQGRVRETLLRLDESQ